MCRYILATNAGGDAVAAVASADEGLNLRKTSEALDQVIRVVLHRDEGTNRRRWRKAAQLLHSNAHSLKGRSTSVQPNSLHSE